MSFLLLIFFFTPITANAAIFVSEIAWMGTTNSASDEWLELYNPGIADISLDGWILEGEDGTPAVALSGNIDADGYVLLERTDDESMPDVPADLIYTGALGNNGEVLLLKDANGSIVDEVNAVGGWPAGDNTTKETMQRLDSGGWVTGAGTPKAANIGAGEEESNNNNSSTSNDNYIPPEKLPHIAAYAGENKKAVVGEEIYFEGSALGLEGEPLENARYLWSFGDAFTKEGRNIRYIYTFPGAYTVRLSIASGQYTAFDDLLVSISHSSVFLSEAAPGPDGWVELENRGSQPVTISSWVLKNAYGLRFIFPAGTVIAPRSFAVFPAQATGVSVGDVGDTLLLLYPNGGEAHRARSEGLYFKNPTPGAKNDDRVAEDEVILPRVVVKPIIPVPREEGHVPEKKEEEPKENAKEPYRAAEEASIAAGARRSSAFSGELPWFAVSMMFGIAAASAVVMRRRAHRIP